MFQKNYMWYRFRRNLIRFIYHFLLRNNVKCAKKIGVRIGSDCRILDDPCAVFGSEPWLVKLGDHVEITNGVRFITHDGAIWCIRYVEPELNNIDLFKPIVIGNNVMIGLNSIILPGVSIGNNVIVGANSVITKSIPDNVVVAGTPAKCISSFDAYVQKIKMSSEYVFTKSMSQPEKLSYLRENRPNWFN